MTCDSFYNVNAQVIALKVNHVKPQKNGINYVV